MIGLTTAGRSRQARRYAVDRLAGIVVTIGGLAVILSILSLLGFIAFEVYPLWQAPEATRTANVAPTGAGAWLAPTVTEDRRAVLTLTGDGHALLVRATDGAVQAQTPLPVDPEGMTAVSGAVPIRGGRAFWLSGNGFLQSARVQTETGKEAASIQVAPIGAWKLTDPVPSARLVVRATGDTTLTAIVATPDGGVKTLALAQKRSLFGRGEVQEIRAGLPMDEMRATALALSDDAQTAYVGTADGFVLRWSLVDPASPRLIERTDVTRDRQSGISALELLIGSRTLIAGDQRGGLSAWSAVPDSSAAGGSRLERIHDLEPLPAGVTSLAVSGRDKRFAAGAADGSVRVYQTTTETIRAELAAGARGVRALAFAPKANGLIALTGGDELQVWSIDDPHPEISVSALFGKIWYEGYAEPAYVWQSTGGTDQFEPKLSLVPLILGTMKGTLYSLLFAAPVAILAALYTSQFCHPRLRSWIKPTVELMAALPSVVLGFLAGLWLAPLLEHRLPGIFATMLVAPGAIFLAGSLWMYAPVRLRQRLAWPGAELLLIVPLLLLGIYIGMTISPSLEHWLFAGDFRHWLVERGGRIDQRNSVVVGFALGFAVIPVIFTIAEDAISNVPQRLVSASLALGATRWQTALRVVLPTASAGIFSAVMVGFGRAVGETMIVLMATGNTPILDWSLFTGMRTLSANIAVEIPEAPFGGTLYRVLFLAALLLFVVTFVLNTAAELVRQRLRKRYQNL